MAAMLLTLLAALPSTLAYKREGSEVGKLPALGWNSWNAFHCDIDESKFLTAAEKLISLGLKDAGYEYVNIDDCWQVQHGRDENKRLIPDTNKFKDGINGTAKTIHDMGLKIGIYSSAGTETCAGYEASIDYEDIDAATWAEWEIDYLKYDNCHIPQKYADECGFCVPEFVALNNGTCVDTSGQCALDYDWSTSQTAHRFQRMRDALEKQERVILYSLCQWGTAGIQQWANSTGTSWRSTNDINPDWNRITDIWNQNSFYLNNVDFYGHSDADMLEVGNGDLTDEQGRTHFAIWALMKSPLLIGTPLDTLSETNVATLANKHLLAFNQDPVYGKPAMPYRWGTNPDWTFDWLHPAEYWSGRYSAGVIALIFNPEDKVALRKFDYAEIPELEQGGTYRVIDAWSGEDFGCVTGAINRFIKTLDSSVLVFEDSCGYAFAGEAQAKPRAPAAEPEPASPASPAGSGGSDGSVQGSSVEDKRSSAPHAMNLPFAGVATELRRRFVA